MAHIYKSNKYRSMICWISQKPRNDRKIKTRQVVGKFRSKLNNQLCPFVIKSNEILSAPQKIFFATPDTNVDHDKIMCREQE